MRHRNALKYRIISFSIISIVAVCLPLSVFALTLQGTDYDSTNFSGVSAGMDDVRFSTITILSGNYDVRVRKIRWHQADSAAGSDIRNVRMVINGTTYDTDFETEGTRQIYELTLNPSIRIQPNNSINVAIIGDVVAGHGREARFDIREKSDIEIVRTSDGVRLEPTSGGGFSDNGNPWYRGLTYRITDSSVADTNTGGSSGTGSGSSNSNSGNTGGEFPSGNSAGGSSNTGGVAVTGDSLSGNGIGLGTNGISGGNTQTNTPNEGGLIPCSGVTASLQEDCNYYKFIELIQKIINFFFGISIPIVAIVVAYAGFQYLMAVNKGGDPGSAKKMLGAVLWGFVIMLSAWLIVNMIVKYLIDNGEKTGKPFFDKPAEQIPLQNFNINAP